MYSDIYEEVKKSPKLVLSKSEFFDALLDLVYFNYNIRVP